MTGRESNAELVTERVVVYREACATWREQIYDLVECKLSISLSVTILGML